jgi:hypothetical protein
MRSSRPLVRSSPFPHISREETYTSGRRSRHPAPVERELMEVILIGVRDMAQLAGGTASSEQAPVRHFAAPTEVLSGRSARPILARRLQSVTGQARLCPPVAPCLVDER